MTAPDRYRHDPRRPWDAAEAPPPLGFVLLDDLAADAVLAPPPPFPLIGIGPADHPCAAALDAVAEAPVTVDALLRQVSRAPRAAAVAADLLRTIGGLDPAAALTCESFAYGLLQAGAEHRAWLAARPPAAAAAPGIVRLARTDDILHVRLDRPAARNAIGVALRDGLCEAFALAACDPAIRAVSLTAAGPAFGIGGDLGEFGTTRDPPTAHLIRARTLPAHAIVGGGVPMDAHVQGACIGAALEIAAFARRLTATPDAWFQLPEVAMGLVPGAGGCVSVPRRIGRQRTALMLLSGRRIGAATALRWGLIDAIVSAPPVYPGGADA